MSWKNRGFLTTLWIIILLAMPLNMSLAQDNDNPDCTIPEAGNASASVSTLTINIPGGVNIRSLAPANIGQIASIPRQNVNVIGWFNAEGTPFSKIADGVWLILGDGSSTVKASFVSVSDAELTNVPEFEYSDPVFAPLPTPEPTEVAIDTENRFEVTYDDWCTGEKVITTQTVEINTDSLMTVPFGLVEYGKYDVVDETVDTYGGTSFVGALSGILIRIYGTHAAGLPSDGSEWELFVAFPLEDGSWDYVPVIGVWDFTLRPVDSDLHSIDPAGQIFEFQTSVHITTNAVLANRTIRPGDHIILFYHEYTTNPQGEHNLLDGCNRLPMVSEALALLIEGGTCLNRSGHESHPIPYLQGLMFLSD